MNDKVSTADSKAGAAAKNKTPDDELSLEVDGQALRGWTSVMVTRSMEQIPNTFIIAATEGDPLYKSGLLRPGLACKVRMGDDLVITGYIDSITRAMAPGAHSISIQGRGKCQDLVDCSAEWKGCQISGASVLEIATKLAAPYGIEVTAPDGVGPTVPQFNINIGETPAEILELITRHAAQLFYETPEGGLVLADVGTVTAASGFVEAENVQVASVIKSQDQRYSEYLCSMVSIDTSGIFENDSGLFFGKTDDPSVGRHRRLFLVAEGVMGGRELAEKKAIWEASRRAGRGERVAVTCDSWRDAKGKLWTPNTLAAVNLPTLRLTDATLCIAEVTYRRAPGSGTTADVILMPPESFEPQPIQLQPQIVGYEPPPADTATQ